MTREKRTTEKNNKNKQGSLFVHVRYLEIPTMVGVPFSTLPPKHAVAVFPGAYNSCRTPIIRVDDDLFVYVSC
jgi:hypothetical protein